jgi:hypothetical protein
MTATVQRNLEHGIDAQLRISVYKGLIEDDGGEVLGQVPRPKRDDRSRVRS